jgi:hypothetical protein
MLFLNKVGDFETSPNAGPCHVIVGKVPWALRILSTTSQLNVQRKARQGNGEVVGQKLKKTCSLSCC